jgi:3-dehydroquinate synthase
MQAIKSEKSIVYFNDECYKSLNNHLKEINYSKLFIIVDQNTLESCYPNFCSKIETTLDIEVIQINAGEINKNIETCIGVWNALSELNADRKCLIINLGGGVVTDLGGFIASTYKRGVNFINVPTSLLAMVDASVGGKTGIDLGNLKNQIGVINNAEMVLIDSSFLNTLPSKEMRSGLAEMLKHGLIKDETYWRKLKDLSKLSTSDLDDLIYKSVIIKNNIVVKDPLENGLRKTLNFGHTLGHAIESYHLENKNKKILLHGEAIAIGMVLACHISTLICDFKTEKCLEVKNTIINFYGKVLFEKNDIIEILKFLKFDKKNSHGNINFVLLQDIGNTIIDQTVNDDIIKKSFEYYSK